VGAPFPARHLLPHPRPGLTRSGPSAALVLRAEGGPVGTTTEYRGRPGGRPRPGPGLSTTSPSLPGAHSTGCGVVLEPLRNGLDQRSGDLSCTGSVVAGRGVGCLPDGARCEKYLTSPRQHPRAARIDHHPVITATSTPLSRRPPPGTDQVDHRWPRPDRQRRSWADGRGRRSTGHQVPVIDATLRSRCGAGLVRRPAPGAADVPIPRSREVGTPAT
jgi:hypothetical protein